MAGLVRASTSFFAASKEDVVGRAKPRHDGEGAESLPDRTLGHSFALPEPFQPANVANSMWQMILIRDLSRPRSAYCFMKLPPCPAGTNTNTASGLESFMRCRNGAKSGLASGTLTSSTISPPPAVKFCLKKFSASLPGAKSDVSVATFLMPFLAAQSAMMVDDCASVKDVRTIYGERSVMIDVPAAITISGTFAW